MLAAHSLLIDLHVQARAVFTSGDFKTRSQQQQQLANTCEMDCEISVRHVVRLVLGLSVVNVVTCHGGYGGHGGQGHHHGNPVSPEERPAGLYDPKVIHDQEHILEHYEGQAKFNESEMSPEELEFHYFKLHDFDNNTKLDGLEILKALTHLLPYEDIQQAQQQAQGQQGHHQGQGHHPQGVHPQGHHQGQGAPQIARDPADIARENSDAELRYYMDIVDSVLEEDDLDNDGYLTYLEYVLARKREEAREMQDQGRRGQHPPQQPPHRGHH